MTFEYIELGDTDAARGASATAGMENANGTVAVPLNYNKPWLRSGTAFRADVPAVLRGRVTDLDSGQPMAGITVYAEREDGPQPRTTTGSDGHYTLRLPYGSHRMVATAADYAPVTGDASLTVQQPQGTLDLVLDRNAVAGKVTDYLGRAVADAEITTNGVAERMLRTGTDGTYRIAALPPGELTVTVQADGCHETGIRTEAVDGEEQLDFQLGQRKDGGGYTCTTSTGTALPVTTKLALTGDEEAAEVQLPFSFPFYGTTQNHHDLHQRGADLRLLGGRLGEQAPARQRRAGRRHLRLLGRSGARPGQLGVDRDRGRGRRAEVRRRVAQLGLLRRVRTHHRAGSAPQGRHHRLPLPRSGRGGGRPGRLRLHRYRGTGQHHRLRLAVRPTGVGEQPCDHFPALMLVSTLSPDSGKANMTTRTRLLLALLAGALLLTGCSELSAPRAAADGVSLTVSGGFAGVRHGIEVGPGDAVFLTDRKGGREQTDALTPAERKKLDSLLDAVDFGELPSRSVAENARDRFEYRLQHDGHTLVTDGSTDLGPARDLIAHLESCMQARR
ncbi:hypothetical protein QFZ22_003476 [Streptomyces canus]|uniref:Carboxypeptidase regulatory-like domain-containing protein n=2 Tax=Streptomyces canus TaxID=58343 RepID=A0AAW8FBJ6_9ACTN|nr:hypothetical protein [Streptomyces canus]MDQ0907491.1 hypothetical protein [Streptomyces canus]